jgi:hypothetical protein
MRSEYFSKIGLFKIKVFYFVVEKKTRILNFFVETQCFASQSRAAYYEQPVKRETQCIASLQQCSGNLTKKKQQNHQQKKSAD